jgi:hypothetical protein
MHFVSNGVSYSLNITKIIKTKITNDYNLQLFTFLTLNGHQRLFFNFDIMTSDIYIHAVDTPTKGPEQAARDTS